MPILWVSFIQESSFSKHRLHWSLCKIPELWTDISKNFHLILWQNHIIIRSKKQVQKFIHHVLIFNLVIIEWFQSRHYIASNTIKYLWNNVEKITFSLQYTHAHIHRHTQINLENLYIRIFQEATQRTVPQKISFCTVTHYKL